MKIERRKLIWTLTFLAVSPRPSWSQDSPAQSVAQSEVQIAPPVAVTDPSQMSDRSPVTDLNQPSFESAGPLPANYLRLGLHFSGGAESNPIGTLGSSSQISSLASTFGSIDLQKVRLRSQTAIEYVGGSTYYGSYGGAGSYLEQTHQLEANHDILWRRGRLTFGDSFNYSRGGDFGSSSFGGAGAYSLRFAGAPTGTATNPGDASDVTQIPVGQESYISNVARANVVETLTQHSSISLGSAYSISDYLGNSQNLYDGTQISVEAGYNYQLSRRDALGVEYGYQMFRFTQAGVGDISTNSVELVYRRRISGRLQLILGGGPAFSRVSSSNNANGLQLNAAAQASLQYRFNRSTFRFSYNRQETGGYGVFAGGNSDIAQVSVSRAISRFVRVTLDGGYARVTGIEVSSQKTASNPYSYGYAGVAVQRQLGRRLNAFASYQLNDQSSYCGASAACSAGVRQHIALIGFDWNLRPIRLD